MKEQEVSILFWWGQPGLFPIHLTPAIGWVLTEEKLAGSGSNLASGHPHGSRNAPPAEKGLNAFSPGTNVEFLNSISCVNSWWWGFGGWKEESLCSSEGPAAGRSPNTGSLVSYTCLMSYSATIFGGR